MGGVTVNLMRKTRLEYGYLGVGTSTSLIVRPSFKTGRFYYVELWVRVHEKNLAVAGQTLAARRSPVNWALLFLERGGGMLPPNCP